MKADDKIHMVALMMVRLPVHSCRLSRIVVVLDMMRIQLVGTCRNKELGI